MDQKRARNERNKLKKEPFLAEYCILKTIHKVFHSFLPALLVQKRPLELLIKQIIPQNGVFGYRKGRLLAFHISCLDPPMVLEQVAAKQRTHSFPIGDQQSWFGSPKQCFGDQLLKQFLSPPKVDFWGSKKGSPEELWFSFNPF